MAYPFFSLAKSKRIEPITFNTKRVSIRVSGTLDYGIATIWDADVLIWAASQIIEARDQGLRTSRLIASKASPNGKTTGLRLNPICSRPCATANLPQWANRSKPTLI
jgi:plasmid replication initiation protein